MLKTLYKKSKSGKIQIWMIEVEGSKFRTTEGFLDMQHTTSEWTQCDWKHKGKANERNPEDQAVEEALSKIKKQQDKGYTEDISQVDQVKEDTKGPMLAFKWEDNKENLLKQDVLASQAKLDGGRNIAKITGLFTRNGKPIYGVPHIETEIKLLFEKIEDKSLKFDGELYNHELKEDFNTIMSITRKQKLTEEDIQKSEQLIQYHIYDIDIKGMTFLSRNALLSQIFQKSEFKYLKLVETVFIGQVNPVDKQTALDEQYAKYLADGYEGQMIRIANSPYENNRSKSLIKRKEFQDAEFTILDIEEGNGNRSGMMGRICFEGFGSNARGTHEYWRELLINKDKYIGKKATVRYQNLTPDGIPRFPVVIDIDRNDL